MDARRRGRRAARPRADRVRARRAVLATSAYTHQLLPPCRAAVHPALRLHPGERAAHCGAARDDRVARAPRRHRRPQLLQLLPAHRRRPDPLGDERGRLLPGQPGGPGCDHSPPHYAGLAGELPASLSRARLARVSLRVGRTDLLHHPAHAVLRPSAWTDASSMDSATPGTGSAPRGSRAASWRIWRSTGRASCSTWRWCGGSRSPIPPEPFRSWAVAGRHPRAPPGGRRKTAERPAAAARPVGDRILELTRRE